MNQTCENERAAPSLKKLDVILTLFLMVPYSKPTRIYIAPNPAKPILFIRVLVLKPTNIHNSNLI